MKCSCCDRDIEGVPTDWGQGVPEDAWRLRDDPDVLRENNAGDYYALNRGRDDERLYVRGVLYVPVIATDKVLGFGLWVRVDRPTMIEIMEDYKEEQFGKRHHGVFNTTDDLRPLEDLNGAPARLVIIDKARRPLLFVKDAEHPVYARQRDGVTVEWWHDFVKANVPGYQSPGGTA